MPGVRLIGIAVPADSEAAIWLEKGKTVGLVPICAGSVRLKYTPPLILRVVCFQTLSVAMDDDCAVVLFDVERPPRRPDAVADGAVGFIHHGPMRGCLRREDALLGLSGTIERA